MSEVLEGDFIGLSCYVGYTSAIDWAPTISWRERTIGPLPVINQSTNGEARFVYASSTTRNDHGQQFECGVEFGAIPEGNIPETTKPEHDMDPPIYSFVSSPLGLSVYCKYMYLELS